MDDPLSALDIFGLTSKSHIKQDTLNAYTNKYDIKCTSVKFNPTRTEQPMGIENTFKCAIARFTEEKPVRFIVSIENGAYIDETESDEKLRVKDICAIVIKDNKTEKLYTNRKHIKKTEIVIPSGLKCYERIKDRKAKSGLGLTVTFGSLLSIAYKDRDEPVPHNDWMRVLCNYPRTLQITRALDSIWTGFMRGVVESHRRLVSGFPEPGVLFQDYVPVMYNHTTSKFMTHLLVNEIPPDLKTDIVIGPEFKGCLFGKSVADHLKIGFIPLRLKGTLPPPTMQQNYSKKYRTEKTLTIDVSEFNPLTYVKNMNVLLVDYVRDTGDSIKAMIKLIEKAGGNVVYWVTISDVSQNRQLADMTLKSHRGSIVFGHV